MNREAIEETKEALRQKELRQSFKNQYYFGLLLLASGLAWWNELYMLPIVLGIGILCRILCLGLTELDEYKHDIKHIEYRLDSIRDDIDIKLNRK